MLGYLGFSYIGFIYLLMLFIPNFFWTKFKPEGYDTIVANENKILLCFERIGEVLVTAIAVIFSDFNLHTFSLWSMWLIVSFFLMLLYEIWWIHYFRSQHKLTDFYETYLGIPVLGALFPVIAFFLLGVYGKVIWMLIAAVALGIGHIGIHLEHRKEVIK